jgi:hypothetical protein
MLKHRLLLPEKQGFALAFSQLSLLFCIIGRDHLISTTAHNSSKKFCAYPLLNSWKIPHHQTLTLAKGT